MATCSCRNSHTIFNGQAIAMAADLRWTTLGGATSSPKPGRWAYKFTGEWKDYKDFTAKDTRSTMLIGGAAADWTQGDNLDAYLTTLDLQYENASGLSLYAALIGDWRDTRNTTTDSTFDYG